MRRRAWLASSLALATTLALLGACKSSDSKSSDKRSSSHGAEAATVKASPGGDDPLQAAFGAPAFEIDGKVLDVGPIGDDIELLSLKELPAVDSWATITARAQDGREFQGSNPKLLTGVRTMKLVKLPAGYEFRVMDQNEGKPYVRHKMSEVKRILIFTKGYQAAATAPPSLTLESKTGETLITADLIEAIPRVPEPNGEEQRDTWKLGDVLKIRGDGELLEVALSNPRGQELVVSQSDLADPSWLHILKRNRRGEFNYRAWKLIEPAARERELRGVTRIELR